MKYAAATSGILATLILLGGIKTCGGPAGENATRPSATPEIAGPRAPARIPDPARALTVARIFALDHARLLFGQIPARQVRGATTRLRAALRALDIPPAPSRLAASLRITDLEVAPSGPRTAIATVMLAAPGEKPWPAAFELRHHAGSWQVTQINEAQ